MAGRITETDLQHWVRIVNEDIQNRTSNPDRFIGIAPQWNKGKIIWRVGKRGQPYHTMSGLEFTTRELFFYLYGLHNALEQHENQT